MTEQGALRARLGRLVREVAKFGLVGGIGVLVNMAAFNLLRQTTDLPVVRASLLASVIAIVCNYVGYRHYTYRDRDKTRRTREATLFFVFSAAGVVIENGILYAATYGFGWDSPLQNNFFKFFGIGVGTLFRFWSYRTWVFRALPDAREGADGGPVPGEQSGPAVPAGPASILEQRRTEEAPSPAGRR
ncbi:GtrA family protein [Streptomyces somaliensis DSM 40738]|uniref:GtrA family protein n=1 Tax=Streptomyces somaliensis (strain ATCC 33201 / DSM 40738 / JCM 12659 / KCTC 9044 / NCTC 11332 / NRRL B-12077 / IP 733) TaxID=1134445 RepID=A0AA44DDH4_STRE0|nr:GtrA family protein [Streptomyces somaliensis]MCQ0023003.1 GtrA family protein [Streptomyces somaliensis DSM 40738]NKY14732.1 GtrA family protein [Streptomyces somaliensis DSM 40738]